jgi:hypothetical protein
MRKLDPIDGLSTILARHHLITISDMEGLRKSFNHRDDISFEDFLLEEGVVEKTELLQALSEYYSVPPCDVVGLFFDHHNLRLIPKDVLLVHNMIPYEREGDNLWVVAAEPDDPHISVVLGEYVSHNILFMVGIAQDIRDAINEYYDESDTYQPNDIANQLMERSQQEVHLPDEDDSRIPHIVEETVDDYESR